MWGQLILAILVLLDQLTQAVRVVDRRLRQSTTYRSFDRPDRVVVQETQLVAENSDSHAHILRRHPQLCRQVVVEDVVVRRRRGSPIVRPNHTARFAGR